MPCYVVLADVNENEFQNPQELAAIWGSIRTDIEELDGELLDSYAILGGYDFLVLFEADNEESAVQIVMGIERHGLDTETMQAFPVDRLGEIIEDI